MCTASPHEESLESRNGAAPFRSRILLSSRPGHRMPVGRERTPRTPRERGPR